MFQQLKFYIKINLFDSWQSFCKFTALSWLCDTPVKWKVSNWIQCKCVFILIKSVMKHFVICVTISHNNRFNFKHVSRYFFTYCRVNPYFPEKLNDVATIQSFVQIFQFSINSTKNVLIDKMAVLCVLLKKRVLFIVFFLYPLILPEWMVWLWTVF